MLVYMLVCPKPGDVGVEFWLKLFVVDLTWFNAYHAYADHLQFLKDLVTAYPARAEIVTAGTSVGGRAITGIHFYGSGGKGSKPAIVLHGTVHAREWITGMVSNRTPIQIKLWY